jgi:hypothetical protein
MRSPLHNCPLRLKLSDLYRITNPISQGHTFFVPGSTTSSRLDYIDGCKYILDRTTNSSVINTDGQWKQLHHIISTAANKSIPKRSHTQKCRPITKTIYDDLITTLRCAKRKRLDNIALNITNSNPIKTPELDIINPENSEPTITLNKCKINSAISKLTEARHRIHMKEKYDEFTAREQTFDKNFMINTKEMIKRSLNRYTKTITIDYALKGDIESDFQVLNIPDQVKTEIASQSYSLFQSRPNEDDPIPDNWKKDFNDLIEKPEHMTHIGEPPTLHEVVYWLQKLGQDKAPGP